MISELFTRHYVDLRRPDHTEALAGRLATDGLATFDGIGDPASLLAIAGRLGAIVTHRDSDPDGITTVTDTTNSSAGGAMPKPGYRAFSSLALFPHTDGTAQARPRCSGWSARSPRPPAA